MTKKAVCPNDKEHARFITVAHVTEDWIVDADGNFIMEVEGCHKETVASPSFDNTWRCAICGAEAKIVNVEYITSQQLVKDISKNLKNVDPEVLATISDEVNGKQVRYIGENIFEIV